MAHFIQLTFRWGEKIHSFANIIFAFHPSPNCGKICTNLAVCYIHSNHLRCQEMAFVGILVSKISSCEGGTAPLAHPLLGSLNPPPSH